MKEYDQHWTAQSQQNDQFEIFIALVVMDKPETSNLGSR